MRRLFFTSSQVALLMMFAGFTMSACSTDDGTKSRQYVDVSLAAGISAPATVHFEVVQAQAVIAQADYNWKSDQAILKVGIPLAKGASGLVKVRATGRNAVGQVVASGESAESPIGSTAITVVLSAIPVVVGDAGVDTSSIEFDAGAGADSVQAGEDGGQDGANADRAVSDDGAGSLDGLAKDAADVDAPGADRPAPDAPLADSNSPVDTGVDSAGTVLTALKSCKRYVHYPNAPATCADGSNQYDVYVNTTVFTPDGKYLVSAGNNTWIKLWKVVDGGLEDTGVVFVGNSYLVTAAISPAGDLLALANQSGDIVLFDLQAAINDGAVMPKGTLLVSKLKDDAPGNSATRATFTTDGKQLVATYTSSASWENAMIVVWDPSTLLPVRKVVRNWKDSPKAVYPGPSSGPIWVASASTADVDTDGGSVTQTTVTLEDVSNTGGGKPTFVVPGEVNKMVFSNDAKSLAIGTDEGEVGLWDISAKNNIQRLGHPIIDATTSGSSDSIYGLAFSRDGAYLMVGSWIYRGPSSLRVVTLQTGSITQRAFDFEPISFGFAPDGATWAMGMGGCGYLHYCKN